MMIAKMETSIVKRYQEALDTLSEMGLSVKAGDDEFFVFFDDKQIASVTCTRD